MPETKETMEARNASIDRVLAGLNDTSANDQQHRSKPRTPAPSSEERVNQLLAGKAERAALAGVVARISGGGSK